MARRSAKDSIISPLSGGTLTTASAEATEHGRLSRACPAAAAPVGCADIRRCMGGSCPAPAPANGPGGGCSDSSVSEDDL